MSTEKAITQTPRNTIEVRRPENRPASLWQYRPDADLFETESEFVLLMDLPGVAPEHVDLMVENNALIVRGRVNADRVNESEGRRWIAREYGVGDYYRRFALDETIDADRISAECSGGVLTVHLPKHETARPKRIDVQSR